jgi:hypothetical protein
LRIGKNGRIFGGSNWFDEGAILEPLGCFLSVAANDENLLSGAGSKVHTLDSGGGIVLKPELKLHRPFSATYLDPARNDPGDEGAFLDDPIQDGIQPRHASVLPLDSAEFHDGDIRIHLRGI